jgi:hypothetical protein
MGNPVRSLVPVPVLVLVLVALNVFVPAAQAADALVPETRTLFTGERFKPTAIRGPLASGVRPEQVIALKGERQGFQLALRNPTSSEFALHARVVPDAALSGEFNAGRMSWAIRRVEMVFLPRGSTGLGTRGGMYPDPLPQFGNGRAGLLLVPSATWGGVYVLFRIPTTATPATYGGTVELYESTGSGEVVRARQPFTLEVRPGTLKQPGTPGSFKTVLDVEDTVYWLQHEAMRNGPPKYPSAPDRLRQLAGLYSFLDRSGVTPLNTPLSAPSRRGAYTCAYDAPGAVGPYAARAQLGSRYFGTFREIAPATRQFRERMMPTESPGCDAEHRGDEFEPTIDRRHTPGVKQDDYLHPGAAAFWRTVARAWRSNGWFTRSTYAKNPFDEPSDGTAAMRATMNRQVPAANVALHRALGSSAKVVLASWPRDERRARACRRISGVTRCISIARDQHGNRRMWDNRGRDDVDVWMPQMARLFGRPTTALQRTFRYSRTREYANRLAAIRRAHPGRETWAYNFYTATRTMPQLTIDAPGTDAQLQYWLLAREGHTGVFVSNTLLGWSTVTRLHPNGLRIKGNPYDEATYFRHPRYGYAAGWGTFLYPGYRPALGLGSEALRNTEQARPVTSLRMEGMREGQEDANLIAQYRARFGTAALAAQMRPIFPGSYRSLPRSLGGVVFPVWSNTNLAQRLEARRRAMILRLTA